MNNINKQHISENQQALLNKATLTGARIDDSNGQRLVTFTLAQLEHFKLLIQQKSPARVSLPKGLQSILLRTEAGGDCC